MAGGAVVIVTSSVKYSLVGTLLTVVISRLI